jgi:hypothetical protein
MNISIVCKAAFIKRNLQGRRHWGLQGHAENGVRDIRNILSESYIRHWSRIEAKKSG